MILRPPRSTLTHSFPTRRSSDLPFRYPPSEAVRAASGCHCVKRRLSWRSEEHTSELQSLMRISYAVFCLKKKNISLTSTEPQLQDLHNIRKSQILIQVNPITSLIIIIPYITQHFQHDTKH